MTNRLRIVFAGTPEFSVPALDALHTAGHTIAAVYTQPDRPAGRGRTLTSGPVKKRALELGLPVEQPASLKSPESIAKLAEYAPDLMVVVAYGLILPQQVLDVPRLGCLNIHASLLPRWRGAAPIHRAILAGDKRSGITIMKMDAGLDTGPMLLVRPLDIGASETSGSLHDRLAALGAEAVVTAIDGLLAGSLAPVEQPEQGVTYASKIRKEEAQVDWAQPAEAIARQVRAFNPWPVAETRWQGQQLRIWEAEAQGEAPNREPGRVVEAGSGRLLVATGSGLLRVHRVQLAGRNATSVSEFLNSNKLLDARLG
jgi:methionyl-tRNA formyltransferase